MLLVRSTFRHDQVLLHGIVNVEPIDVCLYSQNDTRLLFVSCYNQSDTIILNSDLDAVFSSFDSVVLVGDVHSKHKAWNYNTVDRNGRLLLSYCLSRGIV